MYGFSNVNNPSLDNVVVLCRRLATPNMKEMGVNVLYLHLVYLGVLD